MAPTEHPGVATVMGYFQAGALLSSRARSLLSPPPSEVGPPELRVVVHRLVGLRLRLFTPWSTNVLHEHIEPSPPADSAIRP